MSPISIRSAVSCRRFSAWRKNGRRLLTGFIVCEVKSHDRRCFGRFHPLGDPRANLAAQTAAGFRLYPASAVCKLDAGEHGAIGTGRVPGQAIG